MMTTDLPENIRFTFAGREHRYAGVEINGTMVPVKDLLAWVERIGLEPQESRAAESEPTDEEILRLLCSPDLPCATMDSHISGLAGELVRAVRRVAKLTTIEAAPVQGAEQNKPSGHSDGAYETWRKRPGEIRRLAEMLQAEQESAPFGCEPGDPLDAVRNKFGDKLTPLGKDIARGLAALTQAVPEVRPQPISEPSERAAFEAWAGPQEFNLHRDESEKYYEYHRTSTRWAWDAWKARAAHPISEQGSDRVRAALAELVACDKLTKAYMLNGSAPRGYVARFEAAWGEARAAEREAT